MARPMTYRTVHLDSGARLARAVDRALDRRADCPICVPPAVLIVGALMVALAVLNMLMVLTDLL
jgi:hypothetical protein